MGFDQKLDARGLTFDIGYNHALQNNWFIGHRPVNDIKSTLGRLSLRGGTSIVSGNMIWSPFATPASITSSRERLTHLLMVLR